MLVKFARTSIQRSHYRLNAEHTTTYLNHYQPNIVTFHIVNYNFVTWVGIYHSLVYLLLLDIICADRPVVMLFLSPPGNQEDSRRKYRFFSSRCPCVPTKHTRVRFFMFFPCIFCQWLFYLLNPNGFLIIIEPSACGLKSVALTQNIILFTIFVVDWRDMRLSKGIIRIDVWPLLRLAITDPEKVQNWEAYHSFRLGCNFQ